MSKVIDRIITPVGSIPKKWNKIVLQDVSEFITKGATPTTYGFEWVEIGIPFLRSECVSETGFNEKGLAHISEEANDALQRSKVKSDDILISITGNVGRVAIFPKYLKVGNINQHIARVRVLEQDICDRKYIYFQLTRNEYRKYYDGITTGAAYPQLSLKQIRETPIYFPPLPTQRKIATILSAYDDLIENNLKRIKLLEEKAQLTYEEWFVRMKFPGHETVVFDEVYLSDLALYLGRGVTPQYEDGSGFWGINQKANKGTNLEKIHFKEYKKGNWVPFERFAKNGDVLLNSLGEGTIGRCHYYKWKSDVYPVDQHMTIFRGKSSEISLFIFHFLASEQGQGILNSLKKGGTNMTMLNIGDLRTIKVNIPESKILLSFFGKVEILYNQKSILENKNQLLKEARDILLPRLMSGMIDVEEISGACIDENLEKLKETI